MRFVVLKVPNPSPVEALTKVSCAFPSLFGAFPLSSSSAAVPSTDCAESHNTETASGGVSPKVLV